MTLPVLVQRLRLTEHPSVAEAERQARLTMTRAVLERLQGDGDGSPELVDGLRAQYLARRRRLESGDDDDGEDGGEALGADRALRHELVAVQREALARMRREGRIGMGTARTLERDLDLEDARLG
jgi:monovalent cation/hydrogen antiporter